MARGDVSPEHRARLVALADLAGLEFDALTDGERLVLCERFDRLWPAIRSSSRTDLLVYTGTKESRSLLRFADPIEKAIREAREVIARLLVPLLGGNEIDVRVKLDATGNLELRAEHEARDHSAPGSTSDRPAKTLLAALSNRPVPFRRCRWCHRIFVPPTRRRVFCRQECAVHAGEKARREEKGRLRTEARGKREAHNP